MVVSLLYQYDVTGNSSAQQTSIPQTIDEETPNAATTGNGDAAAQHAPMLQVLLNTYIHNSRVQCTCYIY